MQSRRNRQTRGWRLWSWFKRNEASKKGRASALWLLMVGGLEVKTPAQQTDTTESYVPWRSWPAGRAGEAPGFTISSG